jgi:hypothetical protein
MKDTDPPRLSEIQITSIANALAKLRNAGVIILLNDEALPRMIAPPTSQVQ